MPTPESRLEYWVWVRLTILWGWRLKCQCDERNLWRWSFKLKVNAILRLSHLLFLVELSCWALLYKSISKTIFFSLTWHIKTYPSYASAGIDKSNSQWCTSTYSCLHYLFVKVLPYQNICTWLLSKKYLTCISRKHKPFWRLSRLDFTINTTANLPQPAFTCSIITTITLEQVVKYVQS